MSLDDPFERVLGHRLLRQWNVLREGREPDDAESHAVIPALLAIWDMGADKVSGAWLLSRGLDPGLLTELGFLVPAGWEDDDLIDDEDEVGPVAAEVVVRVEEGDKKERNHKVADLKVSDGHVTSGNSNSYRVYRVRDGWVEQHLKTRLEQALDAPAVEKLTDQLLYLGTLAVDGGDVPIYLARGLDREKVRSSVDTELRARHSLGIGLVLQAGSAPGPCLAANVLTPLADQIDDDQSEIALVADKLRSVFRRHRILARGGQAVELARTGENMATLFVPGKGSIDIQGKNRIAIIQQLVDAHNTGPMPVRTKDLVKGIEGQSLANIFGQPLWEIGGLLATLAGSAWARTALRYGVTALATLLFLLTLRRSGERAGRLSERLETMEKTHDAQRRMLEAAARRPHSRDDLAERLRGRRFQVSRSNFVRQPGWFYVQPQPTHKAGHADPQCDPGSAQAGHTSERNLLRSKSLKISEPST